MPIRLLGDKKLQITFVYFKTFARPCYQGPTLNGGPLDTVFGRPPLITARYDGMNLGGKRIRS